MHIMEDYIQLPVEQRKAHLKLDEPCLERGGYGASNRGVLMQFLGTTHPTSCKTHCCHACNNAKCSNPRHLYWGTASENRLDAVAQGHVYTQGIGKMTAATRKKISKTLKGRPSNNQKGVNQFNIR